MKTIIALATAATLVIGGIAHAQQSKPLTSYSIFFYETKQGFEDRSNGNAQACWKKWGAYMEGVRASHGIESGAPLLPPAVGMSVSKKGRTTLKASELQLGGYIIVKATSMDAAIAIAEKSPAIANGGKVEVRELLPMQAGK